jgi:hypothetical protein
LVDSGADISLVKSESCLVRPNSSRGTECVLKA